MPTCWIIAGPNGAGKTTFALDYLLEVADCKHFLNADMIAASLSPHAPELELLAASRIFLEEIENRIKERQDFAFETTLSGRSYLKLVKRLQAEGWRVELIYLALPDVETSKMRVAERVRQGGHNIPSAAIERRFPKSLYNLFYEFSHEVDLCNCFLSHDNVSIQVFEQSSAGRIVLNEELYQKLFKEIE